MPVTLSLCRHTASAAGTASAAPYGPTVMGSQAAVKLAPLEAELQAAGALEGLYDGMHRIDWSIAVWLCFALLFFMGSCTGIGFTACTEPPPSAARK